MLKKYLFKPELLLVLTTIIAALGWIFSKEAVREMPPFAFIGARFFLAGIILLPFIRSPQKVIAKKLLLTVFLVVCLFSLNLISWIYAVATTQSLSEGAFIISLSMLFVPLFAWLLFKRRPQRHFWLILPVAILGLFFLTAFKGNYHFEKSQLFFLMAALTLPSLFKLGIH